MVETATFGAFATVLAEYGIAGPGLRASTCEAARIAREVADDFATDGRTRFVAGSIGPGTKLPSLGQIRFADLRDAYEEQARGLLDGGVDLLSSRPAIDLLQAKAAIIGGRRAMAAAGRQVPIQVQVTMETTGRMLVGSEIGAALAALGALKPDVLGINCATGPREMSEHLRYLSPPLARCRSRCCPTPACPSVVDGQMHYDLTPERAGRVPPPLRHRARRPGRRWLLRHDARAPRARRRGRCATSRRPPRTPLVEPRSPRSTRRCRSSRTPRS